MDKRLVIAGVSFVVFVLLGIFILSSVIFETKPPELVSKVPTHWNLNDEITIDFSDDSGIRKYRVQMLFDGEVLSDKQEIVLNKPKSLKITLPKSSTALKNGTIIEYNISVTDWSNARFFRGNTAEENIRLVVDTTAPVVKNIAQSFQIARGGSAVVAVQIKDMALESATINNGTDDFQLFKYLNDDVYIGVLAWPLKNKFFDAQVVAKDKAGNITKYNVPIKRNVNVPYYQSNINIKEDFLSGKLNELIGQINQKYVRPFENDVERFVFFNEEIRAEDERRILEACEDMGGNFLPDNFRAFVPLKGSKLVGSFGDYRTYFLNKEEISKAVHLGIDVASVKNAPIVASNGGVVLLKSYLGLYGNTLLVYHGFGVYSLYSHMQESYVDVSDEVYAGQEMGKTGQTGWAFGDHLHFGILIQGHFVRLNEWLDQKWVDNNITDVLQKARAFTNGAQNISQ